MNNCSFDLNFIKLWTIFIVYSSAAVTKLIWLLSLELKAKEQHFLHVSVCIFVMLEKKNHEPKNESGWNSEKLIIWSTSTTNYIWSLHFIRWLPHISGNRNRKMAKNQSFLQLELKSDMLVGDNHWQLILKALTWLCNIIFKNFAINY